MYEALPATLQRLHVPRMQLVYRLTSGTQLMLGKETCLRLLPWPGIELGISRLRGDFSQNPFECCLM